MTQPDIRKTDPHAGTVVREAFEIVKAAQPPIRFDELIKSLSAKGYAEQTALTGVWSEIHVPGDFLGLLKMHQDHTLEVNNLYSEAQVNARLNYWDRQTVGKRSPNEG